MLGLKKFLFPKSSILDKSQRTLAFKKMSGKGGEQRKKYSAIKKNFFKKEGSLYLLKGIILAKGTYGFFH